MNYPRYPEYKPTGVEWLGEVPAHWVLKRLKFATACINDKQDVHPEGLGYVAMEHIESWTGKRLEIENGLMPESQTNRFRRGDVLFGKLRPYLAKAWLADRDGVCSTELLVLRERNLEPAYLRYWTLMQSFVEIVDGSTYGSKMPRASWNFIGNVPALIPGRNEQRAIAAFLDRETARIDALIAKKQRLIELLAEKRTALISQAVTKGLNPDAPMKDSGVEWLGEIPAHWEVRRLSKVVSKLTNGFVGPTRDILVESGVRYLQSLHIKDGKVDFSRGEYYVTEEWSRDHSKSILRVGDVLIVQTGDIGQTALVNEEFENCNCHALIIARPYESVCTGAFLDFLFRSRYGRQVFNAMQTGALHPHLNCTIIRDMFIPLPPIDEQNAITKWVGAEIDKLVVLRATVESASDKLKKYRAALIADAVTGKIDVRGFVKEREVA